MKKFIITLIIILSVLFVGSLIFFGATPAGRTIWNEYMYDLDKVDEIDYEKRKAVEDTCRAMISSYTADSLIYNQYKESTVTEEISWANNAKIRANQTASTYNNYILLNSYVWEDNVPSDIFMTLQYLE